MCGGGKAATITVPKYDVYNNEFNLQKSAIESQMSNESRLMQLQLQTATQAQQDVLRKRLDAKETLANNTSKEVQRLTALTGPPPPDKTAQAPKTDDNRRGQGTKGKAALRIEKSMSSGQSAGTGLTIY